MKFKKTATALAAALTLVALTAQAEELKDGTYESSVVGHNAPMTVRVVVKDHKVVSVTSPKNLETPGVGREAIRQLGEKIVAVQSLGIDAVTGATLSSFAFLQGAGDAIREAGGDMKAWRAKAAVAPTEPIQLEAAVVVIGGGGSGLASAVSALQNGASKVVVLEKLGFLGGSTIVSGGAFNAASEKRQKPQGIEDSVEKHYRQTLEGGHNVGNPELVRTLVENAPATLDWLESMGMEFRPKIGTATGALWQRSNYPAKPAGTGYIETLAGELKKAGDRVIVLTDTTAEKLVLDAEGRVVGVEGHKKKQPVTVRDEAVIVATGGFGANVKMRQEVNTGVWKEAVLDERIGTTNMQRAAQGDGIRLAEAAGADVIGLSDIQLHPNGTPGTGLMQDIATSGRNRIFVNKAGDRFVNEAAARDTLCKAIFQQPDGQYWLVMNKLRYPDPNKPDKMGVTINDMLSLGRLKTAATLDELAKVIGVDAERLKASVEEYNRAARHEVKADKFGFEADNTEDAPMTEGPWYACLKTPTVHHTMGGIRIDAKARVLDASGKPVPGLFAAGETTGGIHGANRLGGNAVADVMTFGRIAGRSAAESATQ